MGRLLGVACAAGVGIALSGGFAAAQVAPPSSWTGFYVGANAGYSWGPWATSSNQEIFNFESRTASPQVNGALGGLQAGYNWQYNSRWVFGIESDVQITGEKAKQNWVDPGLQPPIIEECGLCDFVPRVGGAASLSSEWDFPWFGTARVRAGYLPASNWLIYATGGLAFGESRFKFSFSQPGAAPALTRYVLDTSSTRVGYAVGAGAETKLSRNWSVKFEYLYVDLGTVSINTTDIDGAPFGVNYHVRDHIARIGINYSLN
jgi:outer membrane immunogenic protein